MQICPHAVRFLVSCSQSALTASYTSKKGIEVIKLGNECSLLKILRVNVLGCVFVRWCVC